jgi:integrase
VRRRDPFLSEALLRRADILSFEGVCERFLTDPAPGRRGRPLSQATRQGLARIVRKELVPAWGRRNDELRRLIAALAQAPKQVAAVWLMLLYTGNRLRETLRLEWAWIDFKTKHLVLPTAVTKNRRPHLVPLVQGAIALLEMVRALDPKSPYVFRGPDGKPLRWMQRASEAILSNSIEDGRHHDTRRILQTNLAELGVPPHVARHDPQIMR